MFCIRVTEPDGDSRTVPFDGTVATVGRHADNTVSVSGPGISGRHCQFDLNAGVITLHDRGSTNGTFVNNRRLEQPIQLAQGVEVWVGSVKLEVVAAVAPQETAAPAVQRPVMTTGPLLAVPTG
ncbi:MAG: FHA domain-containing protein, partial [Nannocystaceae bacterium]|nr:FHA domain-containing protein [Nannocystaceae bacterium]